MKKEYTSKECSDILWCSKCIAIICTIAAHMPCEGFVGKILNLFGTMGVPFFFFVSGLLYEQNGEPRWKKYINKVWIPWLWGGSVIWIICYIRHYNDLNIGEFLIGNGSYLYFLTVLFCLYFIWNYVPNKVLWIMPIVGIIRVISAHMDLGIINSNLYLSALYWNFWFSIGYFIKKKYGVWSIAINQICKIRWIIIVLWFVISAIYIQMKEVSYFTWMAIPFSILSIGVILVGASFRPEQKIMILIGKNTLSIYIYHILIAGYLAGKLPDIWEYHLISPLIALLITSFLLYLMVKGSRLVHIDKAVIRLLGVKN